jgi:hypothetical protein
MTHCAECQIKLPSLAQRSRRVNEGLYRIGLEYHRVVPFDQITTILESHGFVAPLFQAIGTKYHEAVGEGKYITISLHQMEETKNWEVVAYVN